MKPHEPLRWSTRIESYGVRGGFPVWAAVVLLATFAVMGVVSRFVPIPVWVSLGVLVGMTAFCVRLDVKLLRRR